jgi:hypothetical protein
MARPLKLNADYYTHDKDMRNDPAVRALRRKFGHEGYAIFNMMLEVLTDSENFEYPWNDLSIALLSGDFDTDKLEEVVNFCVATLKLLVIDNGVIYSNRHKERFSGLLSKRKRQQIGVIDDDNTQSKVKYSKEKKKIKKRKGKVGVFFKPEENRVYFDDGTSQELGERQQKLLQSQEIRPYEIEQGLIE